MNLSLYTIKRAELIWVNIWTYLFLKHIFIFIFIFKLWFDFINEPSPSKRTKLDRVLFTNSCFQFLSIFYKGHWFVWFCCTIIFLKNYFVIPPPQISCLFFFNWLHTPTSSQTHDLPKGDKRSTTAQIENIMYVTYINSNILSQNWF